MRVVPREALHFADTSLLRVMEKLCSTTGTERISRVSHSSRSATINTANVRAVSNARVSAFLGGVDRAMSMMVYRHSR